MKLVRKVIKRLKNEKVLIAVVSGVLMILVNLQVIDAEMSTKATETITALLAIGITVGIFGNPDKSIKDKE